MDKAPKYSFPEAKMKLEALCAYQERCSFELKQRMLQWGIPEEQCSLLLSHLVSQNYLSDERFAEAYVSGKVNIKKWGRIRITRELRLRRIPEEFIKNSLAQVPDSVYFSHLEQLAQTKWNALNRESNEYLRKGKVIRFLQTKGYDFHEIESCVKSLGSKQTC